jgi:hypothetical protein
VIRRLALIVGLAACTAAPAAPSASPVTIASPTATSAPTNPVPSPTASRHTNPILGYSVTLPPAWRVSECLSGLSQGTQVGHDVLTTRTASEEHDLGAGGDTGPTGAFTWTITIAADLSTLSPTEYATAHGGSLGEQLEALTLDGRPAVRRVDGVGRASMYLVATAGRMYTIVLSPGFDAPPPLVTDAAFESVAQSISFITPAARPTPTPAPTLSPAVEAVVDAVAAAFASSDADRLRELMPPTCWFMSAGYQSSGVSVSREKMAEGFRTSFAKGLKVTVEARPIKTDAPFLRGPFWVWSEWSAYGSSPFTPQSTTQLVFDQIDGRWYWTGALFNAGSLRR